MDEHIDPVERRQQARHAGFVANVERYDADGIRADRFREVAKRWQTDRDHLVSRGRERHRHRPPDPIPAPVTTIVRDMMPMQPFDEWGRYEVGTRVRRGDPLTITAIRPRKPFQNPVADTKTSATVNADLSDRGLWNHVLGYVARTSRVAECDITSFCGTVSEIPEGQPPVADSRDLDRLLQVARAEPYRCPGEDYSISRALHLARLNSGHEACRHCLHRHETGDIDIRDPSLPEAGAEVPDRNSSSGARDPIGLFDPVNRLWRGRGWRGVSLNEATRLRATEVVARFGERLRGALGAPPRVSPDTTTVPLPPSCSWGC